MTSPAAVLISVPQVAVPSVRSPPVCTRLKRVAKPAASSSSLTSALMLSSVSAPVTSARSMATLVVTPALVTETVKVSVALTPGSGSNTAALFTSGPLM